MAVFDIGETVICSCEVTDDSGNYKDPATSMNISISGIDPRFVSVVASTAMSKDSTGHYHYDFASAGNEAGKYRVIYTATDSARITIEKENFQLE